MIRFNKDIPTEPCVGMRVRIRDLNMFNDCEKPFILQGMKDMAGKEFTIKFVDDRGIIDLDTPYYNWIFKWLEPIEREDK